MRLTSVNHPIIATAQSMRGSLYAGKNDAIHSAKIHTIVQRKIRSVSTFENICEALSGFLDTSLTVIV